MAETMKYDVGEYTLEITSITEKESTDIKATLQFDLQVTNHSDQDAMIGSLVNFRLTGEDNTLYGAEIDEKENCDFDLPKGATMEGKITYVVPKNQTVNFEFIPDLAAGNYVSIPLSVI